MQAKDIEKEIPASSTILWLQEGPNPFGSHTRNSLIFPESVALYAGILFLKNNVVNIRTAEYANITHNNKPIDNQVIYEAGKSSVLEIGLFQFQVINQQGKLGIEIAKKK